MTPEGQGPDTTPFLFVRLSGDSAPPSSPLTDAAASLYWLGGSHPGSSPLPYIFVARRHPALIGLPVGLDSQQYLPLHVNSINVYFQRGCHPSTA